jgi:hypothetical protein
MVPEQKGEPEMMRFRGYIFAISVLLFSVAGWTQQSSPGGNDPELEAGAFAALQYLFDSTPRASELRYEAVPFPFSGAGRICVGSIGSGRSNGIRRLGLS